jgi:hypothetical protein
MNKRRGVFIRTYDLLVSCLIEGGGWDWLTEDHDEGCECEWCEGAKTPDFCQPEAIDGLLAVRNSNGVYECFAVDRHDTWKEPKDGPCSIAHFLKMDVSLESLPKIGDEDVLLTTFIREPPGSGRWEVITLPAFKSIRALRAFLLRRMLDRYHDEIAPEEMRGGST